MGSKKIKCEIYRDSMQNYKGYAVPPAQLVIADVPYCYSADTECWTRNGWKKYQDITLDDEVLSLNSITQEMEYSGIERIIIRDCDRPMIHFGTDTNYSNMDLLVTDNHRMFAMHDRTPQGKGIRNRPITSPDNIRLAKDTGMGWYIPRSGYKWIGKSNVNSITIPKVEILTNGQEHVTEDVEIPLDKWLPFFGLWLADGCVCTNINGKKSYRVSIKQAGVKRERVRKMLEDFPFESYEYKNKGTNKSNFNIHSKQLWTYLNQFGKSKEKFVPQWIKDLPLEYLKLFWDWYTFGDSRKGGNGLVISSVSKDLIEDMQEIALKLGTVCNVRKQSYKDWTNTLYYFQFNPNSRNISYSHKKEIPYEGKVWCITLKTNSVFLVRRNGIITFCGNCVGDNFYGSNPTWYIGGERKNGESKKAGKPAFYSDFNFNLYEYFHFCSKMLKKEDKRKSARGRSSDSPCMIVFCSLEQIPTLIKAGAKYGFVHYIPLVFIKNYSPQVLKANMRIVGATEYALLMYRGKLPKFRNGLKVDENGKNIRGTGHMVFNWFRWERDGADIPKIHPAQKPVSLLKQLIEICTDPGDVVIDPCCGSGTTLRAAYELGRSAYGFEIDRTFYKRAKEEMLDFSTMHTQGKLF